MMSATNKVTAGGETHGDKSAVKNTLNILKEFFTDNKCYMNSG